MCHRLAAEDLDHLVAVDGSLGLEVLPSLGPLVHAHVFDGEGAHVEGAGALLRLFLAVDVLALVALDVVVLGFLRWPWLSMKLDQPLAGQVDGVLAVVDPNPATAETLGCLGRGA